MATLSRSVLPDTHPGRFAVPPWHDQHPHWLDLDARLAPDHLVRRIAQAVDRLDLAPLCHAYAGTGSEAYRPERLLGLVLYEVQRGQRSPAAWWQDARENEPARWLLRGCAPSRSCWYAFRDRVAPLLQALNGQPLTLAVAEGLTPATRGAVDGTLVAAHASRHKLVNEVKLQERLQQLAAVLAADTRPGPADLTGAAGAVAAPAAASGTAAPAAAVPPTPRPRWMAATPAGRRRQARRLRRAQERMTELQARNQAKRSCKRQAATQVVVSLSDPESVVGRDKEKIYRPLYNIQFVDDLDSPFILGYEAFAQQNDAGTVGPVLGRVQAGVGHPLAVLLGDTAYAGGADLAVAEQAGVTVYAPLPGAEGPPPKLFPKAAFRWLAAEQTYACPQGHQLAYEGTSTEKRSGTESLQLASYRCPLEHCQACPLKERCTRGTKTGRKVTRSEYEDLVEALRARMATPEAQALYRWRGQTVELLNADFKEHRKLRRFRGRGLARVRGEVGLLVLAHNLLTLLAEEKKAEARQAVRAAQSAAATPPQPRRRSPLKSWTISKRGGGLFGLRHRLVTNPGSTPTSEVEATQRRRARLAAAASRW